jgi:rod shape-determining protein MreD
MMRESRRTRLSFTVVGSLLTFILQVTVAPNIAILDVVPNFILGFVVLNAMFSNTIRSSTTGFVLGLLFDLTTQAPLGAMSFVLAIVGYGVSSLNKELFSGRWQVQAFFLLGAAFFGELFYGVLLSVLGYDPDFLLSLGMRVLPGALYDAVFGLIVFPLMQRFSTQRHGKSDLLKGKLD